MESKPITSRFMVRDAVAEDSESIADVVCRSWRKAFNEILTKEELSRTLDLLKLTDLYNKRISEGSLNFLVALDDKNTCGACICGLCRDEMSENCGEIIALHVKPEHWGAGVGKVLLDAAMKKLSGLGFGQVVLWTFEKNIRARKFYEKCGFLCDEVYKHSSFGDVREVRYSYMFFRK